MGTGSRTNANVTPSITTMDLMELVIKLASSALEHVADGFVDLFARWCGAGQPFDDCGPRPRSQHHAPSRWPPIAWRQWSFPLRRRDWRALRPLLCDAPQRLP